jgi:hypothetical protein
MTSEAVGLQTGLKVGTRHAETDRVRNVKNVKHRSTVKSVRRLGIVIVVLIIFQVMSTRSNMQMSIRIGNRLRNFSSPPDRNVTFLENVSSLLVNTVTVDAS